MGEGANLTLTFIRLQYNRYMTLTQTAILTRNFILIFSISLIMGIVSFIGYKVWYAYYLANLPPVEEKPDTRFGLLPDPDFPKVSVTSSNFSYSLDTSTGSLPQVGVDPGFEKITKVYFVTKPYASLLSSDKSAALAEKFAITDSAEIIDETLYLFKKDGRTLTVNLDSGNFKFSDEATKSAKEGLDDDNKLISDFKNTLQKLAVFRDEFNNGRTKIVMLKKEGGKLIPTQLRSEAVTAQISIWPDSIDKKSIFTPDFNKALINTTVVGGADSSDNYLSLEFTHWSIDTTTFATYPTKDAEVAFQDLQTGKGVVIIESARADVSITSVYLGYFLSENYSPYLQPIYIFEGPNFVAYVSAITDQWKNQTIQN